MNKSVMSIERWHKIKWDAVMDPKTNKMGGYYCDRFQVWSSDYASWHIMWITLLWLIFIESRVIFCHVLFWICVCIFCRPLLPVPSFLLPHLHKLLKFQNFLSSKKIKIKNLFYLLSQSENKGVWCFLLLWWWWQCSLWW